LKVSANRYGSILLQYLRPQAPRVALLAFFLITSIVLKVANPQIIRYFLDAAVGAGAGKGSDQLAQNLTVAAVAFLGLALVIQCSSIAATWFGENVGWRATNALRRDLMQFSLHLDMSFHNEKTPGDMIERIDSDVLDMAIFFSQFIVRILGNILLLIGILVALYVEDWRFGLALTLYSILAMYCFNRLRDIAVPHWKASREANSQLYGFLEEQLNGTEDIKASGGVPYVMSNLFRLTRTRLKTDRKAGIMDVFLVQTWIALYYFGRFIALGVGFYLFTNKFITLGTAYLFIYYTDAIFRPLREITQEIQNLQKAGGSIGRIDELYRTENKIKDTGTQSIADGALNVNFDAVRFSYNGTDKTLDDLTFNLAPRRVLGLLGRTGSGKTTITRLLFRLYEVSEGAIRLNGTDIRDLPIAELQRHIGMVTQDVQLFRASVRDNLTFFDRSIPDERIMEVIHDLELGDWFNGLPDGLETLLEGGSKGLSAGEAQLLAFARIFLKDPGLVIMDEASSRLDPATEQRIERAIDKLLDGRTAIIVAHRLHTVQRADEIMILDGGRVAEYGDRVALVNDPQSRFAALLRTGLEEVTV
jgi:ATP-binding cassette subfamily B protein/ATP-binding cassette subfamily C protein